jgi:Ca2+-binding EF-hand superfamily protein
MYRILAAKIILPVIIMGLCSCSTGMKSQQEGMYGQKTQENKTDYTSQQERLTFKDYDANKDNRISSDEYIAKQQEIFDKVDKNKSGEIDIDAFIVYWCSDTSLKKGVKDPTLSPIYREMDKNNDGTITYQECSAYWMKRFKEADLDKNNKISRYEYNVLTRDRFKSLLDGPDQDGYITNEEYDSFWPSMRP